MKNLNLKNFPEYLHRKAKAKAALMGISLKRAYHSGNNGIYINGKLIIGTDLDLIQQYFPNVEEV
jgi:hypothetical protein